MISPTGGQYAVLALAGLGAGLVNGIAGGGSLVSFPALLWVGYSPLVANVTSTVGIWPGYLGGVAGFREALVGQSGRIREFLATSLIGALAGAALLLALPSSTFAVVAPWLILLGCLLFGVQPLVTRRVRDRGGPPPRGRGLLLQAGVLVSCAYGAYFGAGLGVILLGVLGLGLPDSLARVNGLRSVLSIVVNTVALVVFALRAPVAWTPAAVMALTSLVGGWAGARLSQRVPTPALRAVVITLGVVAAVRLLFG